MWSIVVLLDGGFSHERRRVLSETPIKYRWALAGTSDMPSTESFIAYYEKLTKSRTQSELDRTNARTNLLAEITGSLAGDVKLETFLIQLTTRIRLVMASDFVLLGLSDSEYDPISSQSLGCQFLILSGSHCFDAIAPCTFRVNTFAIQSRMRGAFLASCGCGRLSANPEGLQQ